MSVRKPGDSGRKTTPNFVARWADAIRRMEFGRPLDATGGEARRSASAADNKVVGRRTGNGLSDR